MSELSVGVGCGLCGGLVHFYTCEQGGGEHLWAVAGECQQCGHTTYDGPCPECGLDAAPRYIRDAFVDPYPCVCGGPDRPCPVRGEKIRLCACGAVYIIEATP